MNFKEDVICNICKHFLKDPVYLPCNCHVSICTEHILIKDSTIKCLTCNEEFTNSLISKPNHTIKKIIEANLHLSGKQKSTKQSVAKILLDFDALLEKFKSSQENFEINISKHFDDIRNKIDLQREELKKKIDDIALAMIDQTKEKEKTLLKELNRANSDILNTGVEDEVKRLLEEFRNPNMILENVKSSIEKQQSTIDQIKANIKDFKFRVDQSKTFYYTPNLNNEIQIFGELNLNEIATRLFSCSSDKTIKIWDLKSFECLKTMNGHSNVICNVEKLSNNQILSCSFDKSIKLWDIGTGLCLKTFNNDSEVICLKHLSESLFASGSYKEIKIWKIDDGRCIKSLIGHSDWVRYLLLLQNGFLASCSNDKTIKIWNLEQGICAKTLKGHTSDVLCLLVSNNTTLVSGSRDKTIMIWDLESGTYVTALLGHSSKVFCLKLNQSGELISGSGDKTIKIWNLVTCTCIKTLYGHSAGITSILIYKDNQILSSSDDATIKLWSLETGLCIQTLTGHTNGVEGFNIV